MKYTITTLILLLVFLCVKSDVYSASILDDLKNRSDTQTEKVFAYLEDGSAIELTEKNTTNSTFYNVDAFEQLCRTEKRFLLLHTHVATHNASSFPSHAHERDGNTLGDFSTIFSEEFYCEDIAVLQNTQRADIIHALYDVTKDVFVVYDLGEVVKKKIRHLVREKKEGLSFIQQYSSKSFDRVFSESIQREHTRNKRTKLRNELNRKYTKAYSDYFRKHCETFSGETASENCSSVNIWEFAEQNAHLRDYFIITPCSKKGEMCVSF